MIMIIETERLVVRDFSLVILLHCLEFSLTQRWWNTLNGRTRMSRQKNLWSKQGSLRSQLYTLYT